MSHDTIIQHDFNVFVLIIIENYLNSKMNLTFLSNFLLDIKLQTPLIFAHV